MLAFLFLKGRRDGMDGWMLAFLSLKGRKDEGLDKMDVSFSLSQGQKG